ncbi:MAG: nitroreductase family protein [Isosphaeraceae bacterium]|nr:nitroreductase family protein [Isosphaeraceae bacterium]
MSIPTSIAGTEAILARRAVRKFDTTRPIDDDLLKRILALACRAPSASNLQPWRFLVVRSQANRDKLRACAYNQPKVSEAPVVVIVLAFHKPDRTDLETVIAAQIENGVVRPEAGAEIRSRVGVSMGRVKDRSVWAMRSTMLAVSHLMLAAQSLGVGSAPMEGFVADQVAEAFGVPLDHTVCCLVALGYPAEQKPFPGRLGLERVCFEEHFGAPWTLGEDS